MSINDQDGRVELIRSKDRYLSFYNTDPENTRIIEKLAEIYAQLGEKEEAENLYGKLLATDPDNPTFLFSLSNLLMSQARYQKAEKLLDQLINNGQKNQAIYYNLAYIYIETKRYNEAIELLQNKVNTEELPEANLLLARAYHHIHNIEEAIIVGKQAVKDTPENPQALGALALSYFDHGDYSEAITLSEKALFLDNANHQAKIILSGIAIEEQRFDDAKEHLDDIVKQHPNSGRGWFSLGLSHMATQQFDLAIEYIEKSLTLMPDFLGGYNTLAWAYISKNDLISAEKCLNRANAIDANLGDTHGGLAVVSALKGDIKNCKKNILIARRLDKNSFSAAFAQVLLENLRGNNDKADETMKNILNSQVIIGSQQQPTSLFDIAKKSLDKIEQASKK